MSDSRGQKILDEWRAVADAATLPAEAPRPSHELARFGIGAGVTVVVVLVALVALGYRGPGAPTGVAGGSGPSTSSPAITSAPSATAAASSVALPNPGGTCSASQFVLGDATSVYEPSVIGWRSVSVTQPMRNTGGDCVLNVPSMMGAVSATGASQAVKAQNGQSEVCAPASPGAGVERECHFVNNPASYTIRSGQSLSVELGTGWPEEMISTPPPCPGPIDDVTRVEFPFATGSLDIDFGTQTHWKVVCSSTVIGVSITVAK